MSTITQDPTTGSAGPHASTHATGGTDPLTPAAIGAAAASHTHTAAQVGLGNVTNDAQVKRTEIGVGSGVAPLDANAKVPAAHLPAASGAVPITLFDFKGDLIVGSGADTAARLGPGADGQVLTADAAAALGVRWGSPGANATAIRGVPVSTTAPASGQILKYNGAEYAPSADQAGGSGAKLDVTAHGWTGNNDTDNRAAWAALAPGHYIVPPGTYYISAPSPLANFETPSGVVLEFVRGAQIRLDPAYNAANRLRWNGRKIADRYQTIQSTIDQVLFPAGTAEEIYPEWFGARPGFANGVDNAPAINRALSASPSDASLPVQLASAIYEVRQPVRHIKKNTILRGMYGQRQGGSAIRGMHRGGPTIFVGTDHPRGIKTGAAQRTGGGVSMRLGGPEPVVLDLKAIESTRLNGRGVLAIDFTFTPDANPTSPTPSWIVYSRGRRTASMAMNRTLEISAASGVLTVSVNIGGTLRTMTFTPTGGFAAGTKYHIAVDFDNARGTLLLLVNGAVIQTVTGLAGLTVTESIDTDFLIGAPGLAELRGDSDGSFVWEGLLDSFRISNISRYSAAYTVPTAKHTGDGNTLLLLNFDRLDGEIRQLVVGKVGGNAAADEVWIPAQSSFYDGQWQEGLEIHGINFQTGNAGVGGVYMSMAPNSRISSCLIQDGLYGVYGHNNVFSLLMSDTRIKLANSNNATYGLAFIHASGQNSIRDLNVEAHNAFGLFMAGGATVVMHHCYVGHNRQSVLMSYRASLTMYQGSFVDEANPGSIGPVQIGRLTEFKMYSGILEGKESANPLIRVDGAGQVKLDGTVFQINTGATEYIQFLSPPRKPVILLDVVASPYEPTSGASTTIPYTTTPQHVQNLSLGQLEAQNGLILRSPDGTRRRVTVDNTGALVVALA